MRPVRGRRRDADSAVAAGRSGDGSLVGAMPGALGAGCAACGSALPAGALSPFDASATLLVLPLDGPEFALLVPVTPLPSIHRVADGTHGGRVAGRPVDPRRPGI